VRLGPEVGLSKPFLVRVNQGKRRLSLEKLAVVLKAARAEGIKLNLLALRPDLKPLIPFIREVLDESEDGA